MTNEANDAAGGRVALVTGASRGIGAHLRRTFADAGYVTEGCSRSGEDETSAVDVTDERAVHDWVADVLRRHGRVDVLVNNAGVVDTEVPIEESDPREWWRTVEIDVLGAYLPTRMVLPSMLEAGRGRIVSLNSGAGIRPNEIGSAYYVAKSALGRITGAAHRTGAGRGVHAFDLAPGVVRTDMTRSMRAHRDRTEWTEPAQVSELALALASGRLDAWSGRFVRAGADTVEALEAAARRGLSDEARTVGLRPYGGDDPLG